MQCPGGDFSLKIVTRMDVGLYQISSQFVFQGHNCSFVGPGHGSVLEVDGEWWLLYHAWVNGEISQLEIIIRFIISAIFRKNKLISGPTHADGQD